MTTAFINECMFRATAGGLGDFVVATPITGYFTPAQCTNPVVANGVLYAWRAESDDLSEHELFTGVYTAAGTTIARTTILQSSNAGAKVNFTLPPKVRQVLIQQHALTEGDKGDITVTNSGQTWTIDSVPAGTLTKGTTATSGFTNGFTLISLLDVLQEKQTRTVVTTATPGFDAGIFNVGGLHFYVRKDGLDTNTGIANTAGGAFLTIQHALNVASGYDYGGVYSVQININDGTYNEVLVIPIWVGFSGIPALVGTGRSLVIIDGTAVGEFQVLFAEGAGSSIDLLDLRVKCNDAKFLIQAQARGSVRISEDGLVAVEGNNSGVVAFSARTGGQISIFGETRLNGTSVDSLFEARNGFITVETDIQFATLPTFATAVADISQASILAFRGSTFIDSPAVGTKKFVMSGQSTIDTDVAYADWPGDVDGTLDWGSVYGTDPNSRPLVKTGPTTPGYDAGIPGLHFYVRTDGSDANTGIANTAGGAFLTIQHAINVAASYDYVGVYSVVIDVQAGSFTEATFILPETLGINIAAARAKILFQGSASNTVVTDTIIARGTGSTWQIAGGATWQIGRFKTDNGANLLILGANAATFDGSHDEAFFADNESLIETESFTIAGSTGARFIGIEKSSTFFIDEAQTYTFVGTPDFGGIFAELSFRSKFIANSVTFTGAIIAGTKKFNMSNDSAIFTDIAYTTWPGSSNGILDRTSSYGNEQPRGFEPRQSFTADHTVSTRPYDSIGAQFDNIGATGTVNFTLPTPVAGVRYGFCVVEAQILKITAAAATTISIAGSTSVAAGNVTSATPGCYIELEAVSTTSWVAKFFSGAWSIDNVDLTLTYVLRQSKTADYTVTTASVDLIGNQFDNLGATNTVNFTLPTAIVGVNYGFCVAAAFPLRITAPSGVTISVDGDTTVSGGHIENSTPFDYIELEAISTTKWVARFVTGDWSIDGATDSDLTIADLTDTLELNLVEQRLLNLLVAEGFNITDDLDGLRNGLRAEL